MTGNKEFNDFLAYWIIYMYLESKRPLWIYWSPLCNQKKTCFAVGLN